MNLLVVNRKISRDGDWNFTSGNVLMYLSYWPLFLILTVTALTAAWLYLNLTPAVYKSSARISITDESELPDINTRKIIDNKIRKELSVALLTPIVKQLGLNAPVFVKNKFKSVPAYTSSPVEVIADEITTKETDKIYFTFSNNTITFNKKNYKLDEWCNTSFGRLKFVRNGNYREDKTSKAFYFSLIPAEKVASEIASKLEFVDLKSKGTLTVNLTDEVPLRGENILKEYVKALNKAITDEESGLIKTKTSLVNEQVATIENDLLFIENKLLYAKVATKEGNYSSKQRVSVQNIIANNRNADEISSRISEISKIENLLQSDLPHANISSKILSTKPELSALVKKLNALRAESESLKKVKGEQHPLFLANEKQIGKAYAKLLLSIQNERNKLQAEKSALLQKNNADLSQLLVKLQIPNQIANIQKEQQIKRNQYVALLKQKEELALAAVSNPAGSKVVDYVSTYPIGRDDKSIYLGAFIIAFVSGVSAAVKKETLGNKILLLEDIEQITKLPVIGKIVKERSPEKLAMSINSKSPSKNQFRKLRATLNYLMIDSKKNRILVTSASAGEGKSFVALNLAVNQAATGKKVVLVSLNSNSFKNISPLFSKKILDRERRQNPIEIDENVSIFWLDEFFESLPQNVKNEKLASALNQLDQEFDFVVIDSSNFGSISNIHVLAELCDATVFVVRKGLTPKAVVGQLDKQKLNKGAIVFNGV